MLRNLILAVMFLTSSFASASGKLSFKPMYDTDKEKAKYQYGLAIHEMVGKQIAVLAWIGGGYHARYEHENWYKGDFGLESYIGRLTVGAGTSVKQTPALDKITSEVYGNLSLKLW